MKYLLLIGLLFLTGCDRNIAKDLETNNHGQVVINGKNCEVVSIIVGTGGAQRQVLFVDCGVGSSSTTYSQGKTTQSVGEFTPPKPSETVAPAPSASDSRGSHKGRGTGGGGGKGTGGGDGKGGLRNAQQEIRDIKKDFYK